MTSPSPASVTLSRIAVAELLSTGISAAPAGNMNSIAQSSGTAMIAPYRFVTG
jgi:hypothetical protein